VPEFVDNYDVNVCCFT